jgi:CRP-like cAMP-binding protein
MRNVLTRKLEAFGQLPEADRRLLDAATENVRSVGAHEDLISEGETPGNVHLILEGFACRYKILNGGQRHIVAYLIPGDFCDLHSFILKVMDHTVGTLSPCKVVGIPRHRVLEMTERPALARALWWAPLVDEATLREWLVNIGSRPAEQRVAHLLCEMLLRLRAVGLANGDAYELPITQNELADTLGMSGVHMNRVLMTLRSEKLIQLKSKTVTILDVEKLKAFSGFNPNYLHLADINAVKQSSP